VVASSGQTTVNPAQTTTYTITATGTGGSATALVTVTVSAAAPPVATVAIGANPVSVISGTASTLTVTATNATSVIISNNVDGTTFALPLTGGAQSVAPTQTTIYTATATGSAGSVTATATVTVTPAPPTVSIAANPVAVLSGGTTALTVTATNATGVVISDNVDATTYTLPGTGGTQNVTLTQVTTYTATATGPGGTASATVTAKIAGSVQAVNHVLFMMQENRTFDTYFGMLNPYRKAQVTQAQPWNIGDDGKEYDVDGIDDKLSTTNLTDTTSPVGETPVPLFKTTSTCLDDMTSAWLESYGQVNRYDFTTNRQIKMDGFVHVAYNYALSGAGSGTFAGDMIGKRAMAYYDQDYLNYYYYMASQFALSDRWFSPVSSKSTPNRLATLTGGTTQGLVRDPFVDDKLPTLTTQTIFQELDQASPSVSWKIYYTLTSGGCDEEDGDCGSASNPSLYPVTTFSDFGYSEKYLYNNPSQATCISPTVGSKLAVGDQFNAFCVDPTHIAPLAELQKDMMNGTLPSFSYIEAGYGLNDEHPGSGQSILAGQAEVATILGWFLNSASSPTGAWADSVFFMSYDEGGGPYDHVPPVPGHSNDNTDKSLLQATGGIPDIGGIAKAPGGGIAVNPDGYAPCLPPAMPGTPTTHCDLKSTDPGASTGDAAAVNGFAAQLGFRLPNMVISPFTRRHYVSHIPMDHTAVIKFVENRFIGPTAHLTNRDAAQPDLLDFFDFTAIPWSVPPTPPAPVTDPPNHSTCAPANMGP
jgi:phospholipase C